MPEQSKYTVWFLDFATGKRRTMKVRTDSFSSAEELCRPFEEDNEEIVLIRKAVTTDAEIAQLAAEIE